LSKKNNIINRLPTKIQAKNFGSSNCLGQYISTSQNVKNARFVYHMTDARNCLFTGSPHGNRYFYDVIIAGVPYGEDCCAVV